MVRERLGKSATFQWNIKKDRERDEYIMATLTLLGDIPKTLYTLDLNTQKPLPVKSKKVFGDRIKADIKDGETYLVTLQKLNYSDENSFELTVVITRGNASSLRKTGIIQLIVEGMEHIIIFCSCFTR